MQHEILFFFFVYLQQQAWYFLQFFSQYIKKNNVAQHVGRLAPASQISKGSPSDQHRRGIAARSIRCRRRLSVLCPRILSCMTRHAVDCCSRQPGHRTPRTRCSSPGYSRLSRLCTCRHGGHCRPRPPAAATPFLPVFAFGSPDRDSFILDALFPPLFFLRPTILTGG